MEAKELEKLESERRSILNKRPDLAFIGDFTPEGNRLFWIEERIAELKTPK